MAETCHNTILDESSIRLIFFFFQKKLFFLLLNVRFVSSSKWNEIGNENSFSILQPRENAHQRNVHDLTTLRLMKKEKMLFT